MVAAVVARAPVMTAVVTAVVAPVVAPVVTAMVTAVVAPVAVLAVLAVLEPVLEDVGGDGADGAAQHRAQLALAELVAQEPARAAAHQRGAQPALAVRRDGAFTRGAIAAAPLLIVVPLAAAVWVRRVRPRVRRVPPVGGAGPTARVRRRRLVLPAADVRVRGARARVRRLRWVRRQVALGLCGCRGRRAVLRVGGRHRAAVGGLLRGVRRVGGRWRVRRLLVLRLLVLMLRRRVAAPSAVASASVVFSC